MLYICITSDIRPNFFVRAMSRTPRGRIFTTLYCLNIYMSINILGLKVNS